MKVRTRFAPSPTGYLHIGGVRTALFCWLFARHHGGRFVLRIDDTDRQRNVEAALRPILDGFRWLGIDWDEGPEVGGPHEPYYQSQRSELYQQAVSQLLDAGHAYRDFARTEEIQAQREAARSEKRPFRYNRCWMADTPQKAAAFEKEGRAGVVRLKMPDQGRLALEDLVRGPVEFDWADEQDHVIQRADGTCLYHLASVVDDHDLEITHVIRAEEHLSNTPRQIFIAQSLGYELPKYAHLPYVAEPGSKKKLSKRKLSKYLKNPDFAKINAHGKQIAERLGIEAAPETFNPVVVDFYREVGYLPEALVNYLLLLGWSLDDKAQFFTREEMVEHFSLERVNLAPASFDPTKLLSFEEHYFKQLPLDRKVSLVLPYVEKAGFVDSPVSDEMARHVARIVEAAGDRIKVAGDVLDYADFFVDDDQLAYDEKAFAKRLRQPSDAVGLLKRFRERLAACDDFQPDRLAQVLDEFVESEGIKTAHIIHALRVAVTGKAQGFGMFETLAILGKPRVLSRIDRALRRV